MTAHFGARLAAAMESHGPLCVGIDPHPALMHQWEVPDSADGVRAFCRATIEAFAGRVAIVKPQIAFFERHGSAGIAALEECIGAFRDRGTLVLVDAKRGDLGTTMTAYADTFLRQSSPLACDAMTVQPYMGFGSLKPAVAAAADNAAGLFVLVLTSNPEGAQVQHAVDPAGVPVARIMIDHLRAANEGFDGPMGPFGGVVGATVGDAARELELDLPSFNGPLLAPGFGAQGAGVEELDEVFGEARPKVIVNSSRGVLAHGPDPEKLRSAAERVNALLKAPAPA